MLIDGTRIPGSENDVVLFDGSLRHDVSHAGSIYFTGTYSRDGESHRGLWFGPLDAPLPIARTGDAIAGGILGVTLTLSGDPHFGFEGESIGFQLNEVALEPGQLMPRSMFVVQGPEGTRDVVRDGDDLPIPGGQGVLAGIEQLSHSAVAAAFVGQTHDRERFLWLDRGGVVTAVAKGPTRSDSGTLVRLRNCDFVLGRDSVHVFADAVLFGGVLTNCDDRSIGGTALLVRYRAGVYTEVVADRQPVPGAPESTFGAVKLRGALPDSTVVVASTIATTDAPVGAQDSLWLLPEQGDPRLLVITGETKRTISPEARLSASSPILTARDRWPLPPGYTHAGSTY